MNKRNQLRVSAGQKDTWALEKLQRMFGGSIYSHTPPGLNTQYQWHAMSRRGAGVMMTLYVLLSPYRQAQIERALASWKTKPARLCKYPIHT